MPAEIVGAAFEQGNLHRQPQRFGEERDIAVKQLILQSASAGGDDHTAPREQCRNQVAEGLARARAGFHDQGLETRQRETDGLRHRGLLGAMRVARQGARQGPLEVEYVVIVAVHSPPLRIPRLSLRCSGADYLTSARNRTNATELAFRLFLSCQRMSV